MIRYKSRLKNGSKLVFQLEQPGFYRFLDLKTSPIDSMAHFTADKLKKLQKPTFLSCLNGNLVFVVFSSIF